MQIPMSEIFKTIPPVQEIIISSKEWNYAFRANNKSSLKKHENLIFDTDRDTLATYRKGDKDCLRIWFDLKDEKY